MKLIKYLTFTLVLINSPALLGKEKPKVFNDKKYAKQKLTSEPAIGMNPAPTSDLLVSNLLQWNATSHIAILSHSLYSYNNAFQRNFNYITNNYNYSVAQKVGLGVSFSNENIFQTFSLLAGVRYNAFKETLNNPEFEKVVVSDASFIPDYGLMYNLKLGREKYFFSYRMYIPFYPYPIKSIDYSTLDGNLANASIEIGVGIHLK